MGHQGLITCMVGGRFFTFCFNLLNINNQLISKADLKCKACMLLLMYINSSNKYEITINKLIVDQEEMYKKYKIRKTVD